VVILVEVSRKAYLASIVPVIVNAILNEHQIIVDIVAFVNKGDFPRSRLGEKQRGKILAGWVSRKMRTMAQFAIKDMDSSGSVGAPGPPGTSGGDGAGVTPTQDNIAAGSGELRRTSMGSYRSSVAGGGGGVGASSLRNSEATPQPPRIVEQRELEDDGHSRYQPYGQPQQQPQYPGALAEMPTDNGHDHVQTPDEQDMSGPYFGGGDRDQTPTKTRYSGLSQPQYSQQQQQQQQPQYQQQQQQQRVSGPQLPHGFELPDFDQFNSSREASLVSPTPPPPNVGPKPGGSNSARSSGYSQQPIIRLPGVDGRESLDDWDLRPGSGLSETSGTLMGGARPPSFAAQGPGQGQAQGQGQPRREEDDWARDAYMSMNLAGGLGRQG